MCRNVADAEALAGGVGIDCSAVYGREEQPPQERERRDLQGDEHRQLAPQAGAPERLLSGWATRAR
jgi:hypothetical protein